MRRRPLLIGLVLLVIRTAKEQEGSHVISLRATCSNMDQGRARVYHLDTGDKTAMKKTEGRWTLDMRFLPDRQMERPMRKRANKREAAEVVAVEPDRHYAQVPCNVACRSNPAPCVQLSGMLRPFLSFSFHRPQQRIRVAFTRSFTHSSFTIIFLLTMHQHLGLQFNPSNSVPPTPPSTQGAPVPGPTPGAQPTSLATGPNNPGTRPATSAVPQTQPAAPQQPSQQSAPTAPHSSQPAIPQQTSQSATPVPPAPPAAAPNMAPQPAAAQAAPPSAADEIAALRARIAELETGAAHGNHPPARAPSPQHPLVADPAAIDRVRASLASTKEESKRPNLPVLQPGRKVSALSLRKSRTH